MNIKNVWLIDDDPMNNVFNSYLIEDHFPEIKSESFLFAGDALKELDKYPRSRRLPDIIFLDISMPIINGWEFLELCTGRHPWLKTRCRIYMLTSSINPSDPRMAVEHPLVSGYMQKPLQAGFLVDVINDAEAKTLIRK